MQKCWISIWLGKLETLRPHLTSKFSGLVLIQDGFSGECPCPYSRVLCAEIEVFLKMKCVSIGLMVPLLMGCFVPLLQAQTNPGGTSPAPVNSPQPNPAKPSGPVTAPAQPASPPAKPPGTSKFITEGDRKFAEGDYKAAITAYNEALKAFPYSDYVYYNRGNANRKLKNCEAAIADYDKALQLNQQNTFALLYRGVCRTSLKSYDAAIADFATVIKLDPLQPMALAKRAEAYAAQGKKQEAIADYQAAAKLYKKLESPELSEKMLVEVRKLK
jgi:hypothetical protein